MRYKNVVFDWGNTLMSVEPNADGPMYLWPSVNEIQGASRLLEKIQAYAQCHIATNATDSNTSEIRKALHRVHLDQYINSIFCSIEIGFKKPDTRFYTYIINQLGGEKSSLIMIGDSLENDVLPAQSLGIDAIWYNPQSLAAHADIISVTSLTEIETLLKI